MTKHFLNTHFNVTRMLFYIGDSALRAFPDGASGKEPACQCRRGSTHGLGRFPGGGHGNPLQYFCLENPMDREAWQATVHGITQSRSGLKRLGTCAHTYICRCIDTFLLRFFPLIDYYKILAIVPYAIQHVLVGFLFSLIIYFIHSIV